MRRNFLKQQEKTKSLLNKGTPVKLIIDFSSETRMQEDSTFKMLEEKKLSIKNPMSRKLSFRNEDEITFPDEQNRICC